MSDMEGKAQEPRFVHTHFQQLVGVKTLLLLVTSLSKALRDTGWMDLSQVRIQRFYSLLNSEQQNRLTLLEEFMNEQTAC